MAKKSTSQNLSAENYIRQRARNLPIYQCLINSDWKESGMGFITLSRKHVNGNITFCNYLVDLKCLGVKDTHYQFNVSMYDYEDFLDRYLSLMDSVEVEYDLIHNIIFAAWEFADEIGFEPHKDFISITQYMLEEDTDDIALMHIACGNEDGKPLYMPSDDTTQSEISFVLNHLNEKVGEGNFFYIIPGFDNLDEDGWDEDDEEELEELFEAVGPFMVERQGKSLEENVSLFLELSDQVEQAEEREQDFQDKLNNSKLILMTDLLIEHFVDDELLTTLSEKWANELEGVNLSDEILDSVLLGLSDDEEVSANDKLLYEDIDEDDEIDFIVERWGEVPLVLYKRYVSDNQKDSRGKIIDQHIKKFPDYPLFKILKYEKLLHKGELEESDLDWQNFFEGRETVYMDEFFQLQDLRIQYYMLKRNLEGIESLMRYIQGVIFEFGFPMDEVMSFLLLMKQVMLTERIESREK